MNNLTRNPKAILAAAVYFGVFCLMLACNFLTPYLVDDFRYMLSFYDNEPIESLWDIVMSMRVHRYHMNGRIVAHSLVQLFAMAPAWVFDIVNAAAYVLQIALLHRIAMYKGQRSTGVLLALSCGVWLFCPAFGQVNLWQDGSCNYLWSDVFALLFLMPYIAQYLYGRSIPSGLGKILFLCLAFCMGAYSETVSAAAIFMATLLLFLTAVLYKRKGQPLLIVGLAAAFLGYLSIYTAPAQWREKRAEMKLSVLMENFANVSVQYWRLLGILLVVFGILLLLNWIQKTDRQHILLAVVFLAGSLASNYIMVFASYYTPRSAIGAFLFLLGADGILLYPLVVNSARKRVWAVALVLLLSVTAPALVRGLEDIHSTYVGIRENQAEIQQQKAEGILDIQLPLVETKTKYSALNGLKYLDVESSDIWPNPYMAVYYKVHSLIGVEAE